MYVVLVLCVAGVFCLTPLALYLLWVSTVNRRERATVVPGPWDYVLVMGGVSGFLTVGGGLLVAALQSNTHVLLRANWKQIKEVWADEQVVWLGLAGGYLLLVAGAVAIGVMLRARSLAVYNLDRDQAEAVIEGSFAELGFPAQRTGDLWVAGPHRVEVRAFDAFRHVTFWLLGDDPRARQELERVLRKRLAAAVDEDNPAAGWFTSAAITLLCSIFAFVFVILYFTFSGR